MVHLKRRDHVCPYCKGVAFGTKSNLTTHIETVHEKRRDHACPYCDGIASGHKQTLTKHIDVVHLKIPWREVRSARLRRVGAQSWRERARSLREGAV